MEEVWKRYERGMEEVQKRYGTGIEETYRSVMQGSSRGAAKAQAGNGNRGRQAATRQLCSEHSRRTRIESGCCCSGALARCRHGASLWSVQERGV